MLYLSALLIERKDVVTFDDFLVAVKEALEDPISLLMDGDAKKALGL